MSYITYIREMMFMSLMDGSTLSLQKRIGYYGTKRYKDNCFSIIERYQGARHPLGLGAWGSSPGQNWRLERRFLPGNNRNQTDGERFNLEERKETRKVSISVQREGGIILPDG